LLSGTKQNALLLQAQRDSRGAGDHHGQKEVEFVNSEDQVPFEGAAGVDRATLLRRMALGGAALSVPALAEVEKAFGASSAGGGGNYPSHPKWKFAFINHVTTNPFFVPTQYGAQDAAALVNVTYTWSGSTKADIGEMINAFNAAVSAKVHGIAVCVVDKAAFEAPIKRALKLNIPVVAYNADGARSGAKARLAYIGQALYDSGFAMGQRIATLVPKGDVSLFIATPGALNIQPRIDGAIAAIKQSGKPINPKIVATDADLSKELTAIDSHYLGNKNLVGMFAVDAGDTQGVGQIIQKHSLRGKVIGGGYDLLPGTLDLINKGFLNFTIDQQPYLQGFYPVLQLFLYRLSSGLVAPSDTNTGLLFVTRQNVKPYLTTKTRYEGSSKAQKYPVS
jgi:simple sugar transport system substrate-binding protein